MDHVPKPENKPIKPPSYHWALIVLSLCLAAALSAVIRGCLGV